MYTLSKRFFILSCVSLIVLLYLMRANAQESLMEMGTPGKQKRKLQVKQSKDDSAAQLDGFFFLPFYQADKTTVAVAGKSQHLHFNDLAAQNNFAPVNDLYSQQISLNWAFQDEENNSWKVSGSYGSASDKPFKTEDSRVFEMTLSKKVQSTPTSSWTYFLNYSNNRGILNNIPLPGFAYSFMSDSMTRGGVVGVPFIAYWIKPTDKTMVSFFYLYPLTANIQVGYTISKMYQANFKLSSGQQSYLRSERLNEKDRIFYDTKKAASSLKVTASEQLNFELELAKVFDRSLFDGESATDPTSERLKLPEEWQGSLVLQYEF